MVKKEFRPECLPGKAWRVVAAAIVNRRANCYFPVGGLARHDQTGLARQRHWCSVCLRRPCDKPSRAASRFADQRVEFGRDVAADDGQRSDREAQFELVFKQEVGVEFHDVSFHMSG